MSCNYADGLSPYENKGKLGLEEKFDAKLEVSRKVSILAEWIKNSRHVVVHTGAGISTSAGIPDFRGPNGVWTLEAKGLKPQKNISFDDAIPTKTHMAILKLAELGKVQYVVSQNIDGLHLRSGLPRSHLAELHGNMFIEQCKQCDRQFVRNGSVSTVGQRSLNKPCSATQKNGRPCRGRLHDTILDWEHNLPANDLEMSDYHSCVADLSICLGTTMQIVPSGNLPLSTKKYGGKLVICNLQPTKHDRKADLLIHSYVDEVMEELMGILNLTIPEYDSTKDPTKRSHTIQLEWTIPNSDVKRLRNLYEKKCCKPKKRKIKADSDHLAEEEDEKKIKEEKTECPSELISVEDIPLKTEMEDNCCVLQEGIVLS
ncbi:NAD-dependent protein deacetylase Sirt6 [Gryllus bimaculatus]|nr:NAD-dependent protein deacetylase Sirt6 [Gryllus bimaculatus]